MKNSKRMWTLGIAALIVGTAAYWSGRTQAIAPAEEVGRPLFPALDLSAVARLEIVDGTNAVVIARQNDGWSVLSLGGYPADMNRLRDAMLRLGELRVGHTVHGSQAPASGVPEVLLEKADGSLLAELLLGEVHERELPPELKAQYGRDRVPDGRYVATAPGKLWQLVGDSLIDFRADSLAWVDRFISIGGVQQAKLVRPAAPDSPEALDGEALKRVCTVLERLFFESVVLKTSLPDEEAGFVNPEILSLTTGTDLVYTLTFGAQSPVAQTRYLRLSAEAAGDNAAAKQLAADFNRRHGVWLYAVSTDLTDMLTQGRAALIKPAKQESE